MPARFVFGNLSSDCASTDHEQVVGAEGDEYLCHTIVCMVVIVPRRRGCSDVDERVSVGFRSQESVLEIESTGVTVGERMRM